MTTMLRVHRPLQILITMKTRMHLSVISTVLHSSIAIPARSVIRLAGIDNDGDMDVFIRTKAGTTNFLLMIVLRRFSPAVRVPIP